MASKRVLKATTDWADLARRIPPQQRTDFLAFKAKSDGYLRKVMANPEEPPKIDWSYYKANVANKALVEQFEKQYAALKLPYPDDKGAYAKIEADKKRLAEDIAVFIKNSNERIKKYQDELDRFSKVMPIEEMNLEELHTYYPNIPNNELENPLIWPGTENRQESADEVQFWQRRGVYYNKGDQYHPAPEPEPKSA